MSKVDWITWKTNMQDIINSNKEMDDINERFNDYNSYMCATVYEGLKHEMKEGGFNQQSLTTLGISPLYDKTIQIQKRIENIKECLFDLLTEISSSLENQKQIEKNQLIKEIDKKLDEERKKLDNTKKLKYKSFSTSEVIDNKNIDDIIQVLQERIQFLEKKLDAVKEI